MTAEWSGRGAGRQATRHRPRDRHGIAINPAAGRNGGCPGAGSGLDGVVPRCGCAGELLGAHMIGAEVTEMIQGYVTAITMEATEEDIHGIVYPHPTMSEAMHEAALDAYGRVIHI